MINQQATAGIIIAGSILGARALAPVDLAIANWNGFVARAAGLAAAVASCSALLPLNRDADAAAAAVGELVVENISVAPPGEQQDRRART